MNVGLPTEALACLRVAASAKAGVGWCATWFEIWKWIQFGEQAAQLNITPEQLHLMMGGDERAVKMVERARKRAGCGQSEAGTVGSELSAPRAPDLLKDTSML